MIITGLPINGQLSFLLQASTDCLPESMQLEISSQQLLPALQLTMHSLHSEWLPGSSVPGQINLET